MQNSINKDKTDELKGLDYGPSPSLSYTVYVRK